MYSALIYIFIHQNLIDSSDINNT